MNRAMTSSAVGVRVVWAPSGATRTRALAKVRNELRMIPSGRVSDRGTGTVHQNVIPAEKDSARRWNCLSMTGLDDVTATEDYRPGALGGAAVGCGLCSHEKDVVARCLGLDPVA